MKRKLRHHLIIVGAAALGSLGFLALGRAREAVKFRDSEIGKRKDAAGDVHYAKLALAGDAVDRGFYDPSIAYAPDGRTGWLAYSSVTGAGNLVGGKFALGQYVSTHLARTVDGGATWTFVKAVNASTDGTLIMSDGAELKGVWRYEVSSLVCDAADPDAARRWKLFVHRYFWEPKRDRMFTHGWIALRTTADPAGAWSEEVPLFGAGKNPPVPYHTTLIDLNTLDSSLKDTVVYSEPGVLADGARLCLSLSAVRPRLSLTGVKLEYRIILLASDDHGATWRFVRTLLDPEDAARFGCEMFDGSSLARENGRFFLLVTPGHQGAMHDGTVAFAFESFAEGKLRRDANGQPIVAAYFAPQPGIFSGPGAGQATYDSHNIHGGLILPQFNLRAYPEAFQLYQTGRRIVEKE